MMVFQVVNLHIDEKRNNCDLTRHRRYPIESALWKLHCGPKASKSALAPICSLWVRFNSIEHTTLSMLIDYPRWPWVCRERNARGTVRSKWDAKLLEIVFCRLITRDGTMNTCAMGRFCKKLFCLHVMTSWNLDICTFVGILTFGNLHRFRIAYAVIRIY